MSSSRALLDCGVLLEHAANAEAMYAAANELVADDEFVTFGHPDPPRLVLFGLSNNSTVVLMIAYTPHCVSAQILSPQQDTEPVNIGNLILQHQDINSSMDVDSSSEQNETINCLTVVALEDSGLLSFEQDHNAEKQVTVVEETDDSDRSGGQILLKGVLLGADRDLRIAIVLGTTKSRLYSVELKIDREAWTMQPVSLSDDTSLFEVLPPDNVWVSELIERKSRQSTPLAPFRPFGGITSLSAVRIAVHEKESMYVLVAYGDGSIVRMHHAGLFPSVWKKGAAEEMSLDDLLGTEATVRCQVRLPPIKGDFSVVPLPKYHPSPLAPLPPYKPDDGSVSDEEEMTAPDFISDEEETVPEVFEALVHPTAATDLFPTLCFYTSENQFVGRIKGDGVDAAASASSDNAVIGAVVGGTKALVGGVVGALRWGLGGGGDSSHGEHGMDENDVAMEESIDDELPSTPFPSLWRKPVDLYAGYEFHDAPRQIEHCSIDPDGQFLAVADALGRVLLIDLSTKHVVRMWKGFREASCCWVQMKRPAEDTASSLTSKPLLYLVIHTRHRRVVEVWRAAHGPRVSSVQVGRDAHVIPCTTGAHHSYRASCYLVHSNVPGTTLNHLERIEVDGQVPLGSFDPSASAKSVPTVPSSREAALRLQHLQQLLSTTNVQLTQDDVYNALQEIKSLADLATAIDLLACSSILEEKLGVVGSEFQKKTLAYCKETLDSALNGNSSEIRSNPSVKILTRKIEYHSKIVKAFDVLRKFEATPIESGTESRQEKSPSHWTAEAVGWVSTYEQVMGSSITADSAADGKKEVNFSTFASACVYSGDGIDSNEPLKVYFSDSSRTRREILIHVFKPLLADVFSFNVMNSIFEALGTRDDSEYIMKCLGEWFMTLTTKEIYERGLFASRPPMVRLLQDLASRQLQNSAQSDKLLALNMLFDFCEKSTDLTRSFMLSALCREAVATASSQKEKISYGKILSSQLVKEWDDLLRKIRVCLLVSLRLKGARLGAFPLSVHNVNLEDAFSVYEWLARDELLMTHNQEEIVCLEKACAISSYVFDPSTSEGDRPSRYKMLQTSCLSSTVSEEERAEYLVDFDDEDSGALLLFLSSHNEPGLLVAHRALLLAAEWSHQPRSIEILKEALKALKSLEISADYRSLALAVRLEVWQTRVCPIYRARLFGFDDVQGLSEDTVAPLLEDQEWLSEFGCMALEILELLTQVQWVEDSMNVFNPKLKVKRDESTWPAVRVDFVLQRLVEKTRKIDQSAYDAHAAVISGLLVSGDIATLVECVPAIYECFLPLSLFNPVAPPSSSSLQQRFLEDAVVSLARGYNGPAIDSFDVLDLVEVLAVLWGFDAKLLRTIFLLAMYEIGSDRIVDELLTKSSGQIQVHRFVEDGVDIACRRLNDFLKGSRMRSADMRDVLGLLDADLCEWIQQRAEKSNSLAAPPQADLPVGNTHLFTLRLLSLSASANADTTLRVKIHSLAVLSGTLVKALAA